ncbi:MAG: hypothetical protein ACR5K7_01230 [Symbiopectobacterium sp.]
MKPNVEVITLNQKTYGEYALVLTAWSAYVKHVPGGSDESALKFVTELYRHAPVLDTECTRHHY